MDIKFTDEDGKSHSLSKKFISTLEKETEFRIVKKLSEEGHNLALVALSTKDNKSYVLQINKNFYCFAYPKLSQGAELILKMQRKKSLNNSIARVYDSFIIKNIKLSDDQNYCTDLESEDVLILVQEYLGGTTLDEKIFRMARESLDTKITFLLQLKDKMIELLTYFEAKDLYYYGLQSTDMVGINDLTHIQLSSLVLRNPNDLNTLTFTDVDSFTDRKTALREHRATKAVLNKIIMDGLKYDIFSTILRPLSTEESKIAKYSVMKSKRKAGLFLQSEIGQAFAEILFQL